MSTMQDGGNPGRKVSVPSWWLKLAALVLVVVSVIAIRSTARVFSGTVDEPAHIAAGMQRLTTDRYDYDLQHPPLGRIAVALGPYASGVRGVNAQGIFDEGAAILGSGAQYVNTLASARLGTLAFFILLVAVVWRWGQRLEGDVAAAIAVLLLVTNPNVLAHAGLATTDMSCAATTTLALLAGARWLQAPSWKRALWFGVAAGLAVSSRLSAIAFVGGPLFVCYILRAVTTRSFSLGERSNAASTLGAIGVAAAGAALVIWAAYGFAFGPMQPGGVSVPAPAFVAGVERFLLHGSSGHPTFLLGTPSNRGWWYYFPVALLVKTPPPLLICTILGAAATWNALRERRDWFAAVPLVSAATMLLISLTVKVNLGVRLVLPIYPLLAIAGAQGLAFVWREHGTRFVRIAAVALLAFAIVTPIRAHPDHLAYFNALAGDHPERVLVDSNLDWGQDLYRLRDTLAARGVTDSVYVAYFGTADLVAAGVPRARVLGLRERRFGWIAASETYLAGEWVGRAYAWLLDYEPVARIGPSMRLWHITPEMVTKASSSR